MRHFSDIRERVVSVTQNSAPNIISCSFGGIPGMEPLHVAVKVSLASRNQSAVIDHIVEEILERENVLLRTSDNNGSVRAVDQVILICSIVPDSVGIIQMSWTVLRGNVATHTFDWNNLVLKFWLHGSSVGIGGKNNLLCQNRSSRGFDKPFSGALFSSQHRSVGLKI